MEFQSSPGQLTGIRRKSSHNLPPPTLGSSNTSPALCGVCGLESPHSWPVAGVFLANANKPSRMSCRSSGNKLLAVTRGQRYGEFAHFQLLLCLNSIFLPTFILGRYSPSVLQPAATPN